METLTWFDIEQYVLGDDECTAVQLSILRADMITSLMILWGQRSDDDYYEKVVPLTLPLDASDVLLTEVGADVHKITRMTGVDEDGRCTLVNTVNICLDDDAVGMPSAYESKGYGASAKLYFNRTADIEYTFEVTYQRLPETNIVVDVGGVDTYQVPDIPPALYSVLRDLVKARYFASTQDWSNASPQLQLANNSFDAVRVALDKNEDDKFIGVSCMTKWYGCGSETEYVVNEIVYPLVPEDYEFQTDAGYRRTHEYSVREQ